jgi:hypothetical protein
LLCDREKNEVKKCLKKRKKERKKMNQERGGENLILPRLLSYFLVSSPLELKLLDNDRLPTCLGRIPKAGGRAEYGVEVGIFGHDPAPSGTAAPPGLSVVLLVRPETAAALLEQLAALVVVVALVLVEAVGFVFVVLAVVATEDVEFEFEVDPTDIAEAGLELPSPEPVTEGGLNAFAVDFDIGVGVALLVALVVPPVPALEVLDDEAFDVAEPTPNRPPVRLLVRSLSFSSFSFRSLSSLSFFLFSLSFSFCMRTGCIVTMPSPAGINVGVGAGLVPVVGRVTVAVAVVVVLGAEGVRVFLRPVPESPLDSEAAPLEGSSLDLRAAADADLGVIVGVTGER